MKKWLRSSISLLLAVFMIVSNISFIPAKAADDGVDLSNGLLAHYDFENASGTSVPNTVDAAAYTGTLSGSAAVVDLEGIAQPGKALQLGSAAGGMQLTDIVNASTSSFSVSLWYKASATSSSNVNLVQAGTIGGSSGRTILILAPSAKYYTYLTADAASITTSTAVTPTAWQHVTFVYDLTNSKAYFYVNGVADRADGLSLSGTAVNVSDMIIGRHRNANEGQFNGLIDEVRVYNKVLSATEAAAIYENTKDAYGVPPVGDITLTVDAGETERVIDSDSIFGINHRYAFNGYGSFDSTTMEIKDDFLTLYEDAGFGSIRYPGGTISNLFNWRTSIGPVEDRKMQIHGFYNYTGQGGIAPNFGLDEIGAFAESVDSEIVYVYSLGRGNAQDAADLIEYLNAKVGTNPNGGIDWAAVRAANGHEEPYNVRYFEIGNEMQQAWAGSDGVGSQGYWTTSVAAGSEAAYIDGGTAAFTKEYAVCEEDWNATASLSDGSANMVRYMRYANLNPKKYDENGNIVDDPSFKAVNDDVTVYVGSTQWTIVDSFENSGASDQHVVIDYSTGAIKFGDGVNGAIPASGQQIYVSYSVERDGFLDISQAIKDTTAAINEKEGTQKQAYVYSSYETQGFITGMANRNANDLYDGLTIHPYSGTPSGTGDTFYDSAMSLAESAGIQKVQEYVNMMPAEKVPVISEYGIFRSTDTLVRSQTHAIYIAKVLMEYVRLGSPYIQKHCLIDWYSSGADSLGPTQQAVIQAVAGSDADTKTGEGTFTFFSTPSAHVFKMLNSAFADEVISTQFSATPTMSNGAATLSALASKDGFGTVYLAIVNASREDDYELTLNLENIDLDGASVTAQILTTDSYDAQNTPENPNNVTVTTREVTFDPDHFTYTVPKHTFVILKIDPVDEIQDKAFMVTAGQTLTVTDTTGNYVDALDKSSLDETIATVAVTGTTTPATKTLSEAVTTLVSGKQYLIVNTRAQKPVTNNPAEAAAAAGAGSGLSLSGSTQNFTDAAIWTITGSNSAYTIQDASGKYLTIASNAASVSDTAADLTLVYGGSTWTIAQNGAYLNHFGGSSSTCAAGWQDASAAGDAGSQWAIYEVITVPGSAATEITFTGISQGETSVRVGGVNYHITVTNENVSAVTLDYNYTGANDDIMTVFTGAAIGELPVPMRPGHTFFGWYLNGSQVDSSYVVNDDVTLVADWVTVSTKDKPENGTTTAQPFPANDANGNAYCYRIPGIVTLNNGTVIAMADQRWNVWYDCGGLDTIVSVSADNGKNWTYTYANYLGDNGDTYSAWSTTFIDPAIATDGTTAYMIADLFPAGVSTMANGYASQAGSSGFDAQGRLILRDLIGDTYKVGDSRDLYIPMATSRSYDYYLNPEADGSYTVRKAADDSVVEGYTVDAFFHIRSTDGSVNTHLFMADSPYQVYPTNYLYMNTSADGLTWSAPKLLNLKRTTESAFLVGPGSGTYDPNTGCMIFTAYSYSGSAGSQRACLIWMDEEGNWTRSDPATDSQWSSEAAAVVLKDGTIRVFFRDTNTLLSYTDYKWVDGAYVRDENNVRITTDAAKNGGNGCMLSALKYSLPINGKEAIMIATPSTSGSRSNGRIYVFLVNDDGTMDLAYDYDITEGEEYYAYSCLTELKTGEEAGNLALFWEDSWNNSPAAATIHYSVIPVEQITAREYDVLHTYVDVELGIGDTAVYTDKTGDYSTSDTSSLDPDIATVQITAKTQQVDAVAVQSTGTKMPLTDCLYTFDLQADSTWLISAQTGNRTVYIDPYISGNGGYPNREYETSVTLLDSTETDDQAVNFETQDSGSSTGVGYLHFWDNNDSKLHWDNCTSNTCTGHDLLLYRAAEEDESSSAEIPGYVCINGTGELEDGGKYLIVAHTQSGLYCIMTPAFGGEKLDHVSQVNGNMEITVTEITFTGVAPGVTSVQIGLVVYKVTVGGDPDCPHENTEVRDAAEATCTTPGYTGDTWCLDCQRKISEGTATELAEHTWTETVADDYLKTAADCENAAVYYKSCSVCGEAGTETFVSGEALGHAYGEPVIVWNDDNTATATVTCANDESHVETLEVTVTSETTDGDCETKAVTTYTATVVYNEKTYTDTKSVEGELGECADTDKDHKCDVCEDVLSECVDENKDYKCDICGAELEKPVADSVIRLAGAHRWATSLMVADEMKANLGVEKFGSIIIASGNDFADALAGSYLSTVKSAPILLSWGQGGTYEYLDTDNIDYIKANLAEGGTVYILGGVNAVPELYEEALKGYNVKRLGGADRFETNLLILAEAGVKEGSEILVCTSTNFADSLSASATGKPILLVFNELGKLYGAQPEYLAGLKNCTFTVIGGESAVSADLAKAIETYGKVERLAGANRFETSVLVAEKYFENPETAVLAYAWNYPDGLCGGSLAYSMDAPLVLTMTKYEAQAVEYATENSITSGIVLGGDGLISDDAVRAVFAMDADDEIIVK